jgi:putative addiction module component (TIGR02574 family)
MINKLIVMEVEMINKQLESILQLDLKERIYVYQLLWQSILKDMQMETNMFTDEQKDEIDKRIEKIDNGEAKLFSWEDVKQEIKASL